MKDHHEIAMKHLAQQATWMAKTGGYAKDMTLRDYFAGLAMQSFIDSDSFFSEIPLQAYEIADAMLKEHNK